MKLDKDEIIEMIDGKQSQNLFGIFTDSYNKIKEM